MKKKWYFGTLLSALALLVIVQQQSVVPNQEIVLEFTSSEVSATEVQNAISDVTKQLQSIGVQHTRISKELKKGKLKISYYSDADVALIKRILSKDQNVTLGHIYYTGDEGETEKLPLDEDPKDYSFDVHEIQKSTNFDIDYSRAQVLEVKQEQKKYTGDDSHNVFAIIGGYEGINTNIKITQKIRTTIAVAIGVTSYDVPEIRAGPIS